MRYQKPVRRGERMKRSTWASPAMQRVIEREALRWGVSTSFVIHTCVGFALGEATEDYRKEDKQPRRRK